MPTLLMLLLVLLMTLGSAMPSAALSLTFTGLGGLSGTLEFDDTTPITVTVDATTFQAPVAYGVHDSPLNHIEGTYGAFAFEGSVRLYITNLPSGDIFNTADDNWIVRADVTGPTVNGLELTKLNLFIYRPPDHDTQMSLTPPVPTFPHPHPSYFSYAAIFSDGSFATGQLTSLAVAQVPEPALFVLVILGALAPLTLHRVLRPAHR